MRRRNSSVPPYPKRAHASGQARIKVHGADVYLGIFNSPESRTKYAQIVAEHWGTEVANAPPQATYQVDDLLAAFIAWAETRYVKNGKQTTEVKSYLRSVTPVSELYGSIDVNAFGPKALAACRSKLIEAGYCRTKINQYVSRIRRVWKWGVSREMVATATWQALTSVEGLRRGQAKERAKVTTVPTEHVEAIKARVLPPVRTMIDLQLATAMRPQEVTAMRTCDIFADSPLLPAVVRGICWLYVPPTHKTEHHEKQRLIFLGPNAQELLRAWMRPDAPELPLFSPAEAIAFARSQRAASSMSPRRKVARKANPKRKPGSVYSPHAYTRSIAKACKDLAVPLWAPNRLRHNAATLIRQRYGLEIASVILGHSNLKTSEVYAEADLEKAAKAISEMG